METKLLPSGSAPPAGSFAFQMPCPTTSERRRPSAAAEGIGEVPLAHRGEGAPPPRGPVGAQGVQHPLPVTGPDGDAPAGGRDVPLRLRLRPLHRGRVDAVQPGQEHVGPVGRGAPHHLCEAEAEEHGVCPQVDGHRWRSVSHHEVRGPSRRADDLRLAGAEEEPLLQRAHITSASWRTGGPERRPDRAKKCRDLVADDRAGWATLRSETARHPAGSRAACRSRAQGADRAVDHGARRSGILLVVSVGVRPTGDGALAGRSRPQIPPSRPTPPAGHGRRRLLRRRSSRDPSGKLWCSRDE